MLYGRKMTWVEHSFGKYTYGPSTPRRTWLTLETVRDLHRQHLGKRHAIIQQQMKANFHDRYFGPKHIPKII